MRRISRRCFGGMVGALASVMFIARQRMDVLRPLVDCDLAHSSLLQAMVVVGEGPYTLRVPPENAPHARSVLSRAFGDPERYMDFTIKVERLDHYVDSWALDNGRQCFYSSGA